MSLIKAMACVGLVLILHGCLNLNLKQILPEIAIYDLNAQKIAPQTCKNSKNISLVGILSADLFNTKKVVLKNNQGQIHYEKRQQFVDLPKNMLKTMVILQAFKECVFVTLPPHSALPQASLKINILSFGILDHNSQQQAEVVLGYDITTSTGTQSYIVAKHENVTIRDSKREKTGSTDAMQALQRVSYEAVQGIVTQIKRIL